MEIKDLYNDERTEVVAVYEHGELKYTMTTIYDHDGYIETIIRVDASGTYSIT